MKNKITALFLTTAVFVPGIPAAFAADGISNESELASAISTGGDYELTADVSAANVGINQTATTGTLSGNGHTLTKSNSKWGDAILYQNCAGSWTFSDMTIDGNKSTGTFSDAALWYMAGTVTFDNVNIRNFKTSKATRYALNCNSTANVTLNNVTFSGNDNSSTNITPDIYIDGGTLKLSGDTKASVYYAGGAIDISNLTKNCNVTITAADQEKYKTLCALSPALPTVAKTKNADVKSVTLSASGIEWGLSGEKARQTADGAVAVYASAANYSDSERSVRIYAAAYSDGRLNSAAVSDLYKLEPNSAVTEEFALNAADGDSIRLFFWDSETQEPLFERANVTKVREDNLVVGYDFENASDTASLLYGGVSIKSGAGISGNGVVFDGNNGYMQLPNNIMSDNMTVTAWVKTDTVQNWARLFDFGTDTSNYFFYSPSNGRVESRVNGAQDTMDVTAFANTGVWEHYAVTRTNNKVQLYRNGVLISEAACKNAVSSITEATNYIGKSHYDVDKYFCGVMDEINIYNKILSGEEIDSMYRKYAYQISAQAAYRDYALLDFGTTELTGGTLLPQTGANNSGIKWSSSDESVIEGNKIVSPAEGASDKDVVLTAVVTNGDTAYTKLFNVRILAAPSIKGLVDYSMSDVLMTNEYLTNANAKMADYLKDFDIDRSVEGFRRTAGIGKGVNTYGSWETSLIAGHGIGHYVSSIAQGYKYSTAGTPDEDMLRMSNDIIDALYEAQIKEDGTANGAAVKKGYLFATTDAWSRGSVVKGEGQFDNVENNRTNITTQVWVPWYTMHKILAGLVDTYKFTGNERSLEMAKELGDWVYNRVSKYDSAMQTRVLNIEYGGMNDVLYELYKLTGDENHAKAAHIFDEISLFDQIYNGKDVLANKHANTTIPKIMGALNRYITQTNTDMTSEMLGDSHDAEYYLTVAQNFFDMVVDGHSYVTGGTGQDEHFRAANANNATRDNVNNETCASYNMLKIARELYKITGDKKYADYYENTFLNSIVASQNPETGMTMYFQPMASGYFKVYSSRWNDFWCCTASGMENFTKLTDSIYYKGDGRIVVNQYISSVLTDTDNNIKLTQNSALPNGDNVSFAIEPISGDKQAANITLRIPEWTASAPVIKVNGETIAYTRSAGFAEINREWSAGDIMEVKLPMELRAYGLADSDTVCSFKYGPTVLSVGWKDEDKAEQSHGMAVRKPKNKSDINEYITIDENYGTREEWLSNVNDNFDKTDGKLEFTMKNTDQALVFTPHYSKYDERYGIYWYLTDNGMPEVEEDKYTTIDSIEFGHDQQENGHGYSQEKSVGYEAMGDMPNYREIAESGFASYQMAIEKGVKNYLGVTYHASDAGKKMSIYAGDTLLTQITASGNDETVLYELSEDMINNSFISTAPTIGGMDAVNITFRADSGTDAPKLCGTVKIVKEK